MEPVFYLLQRFALKLNDGDLLGVFFLKNKDYYMTSISSYVDLTVDVKKLPQFDKMKEILDLANAILVLVCFLVIKKRYRNHV